VPQLCQDRAEAPAGLAEMTEGQAYVVPIEDEDGVIYAIADAQGRPLAMAPTRALAFAAIRQHGYEPVDAH